MRWTPFRSLGKWTYPQQQTAARQNEDKTKIDIFPSVFLRQKGVSYACKMFSVNGIEDGYANPPATASSASVNSSDEDMLDIQHSGTTSNMPTNGRSLPSPSRGGGSDEIPPNVAGGDELPEAGMGQYDDFHTIDWQRDIARDRMRHRHIVKKKKDSFCDLIRGAHDAWSGWLCVLLVGLCSGVMAGIIDIGATWLTDIKFGICPSAFYLNKEQCCWSSNETVIDISGNCSLW